MILEGLLTTIAADGSPHIAPMGPIVDESLDEFTLRPFQSSTSYQNLKRTRSGVFHVTDDVEMLARAAVGELQPTPPTWPLNETEGFVLAGACRWFALRVEQLDDASERTTIRCRTVARGEQRPFFGLNRAKHAVVEGAILATRLQLLPHEEIARQFVALRPLIDKTGGAAEERAFAFLEAYVRRHGVPLSNHEGTT